jgi:hypothetical protein
MEGEVNKQIIEEWVVEEKNTDTKQIEKEMIKRKRKRSSASIDGNKVNELESQIEKKEESVIVSDAFNLTEEEKRKRKFNNKYYFLKYLMKEVSKRNLT